jgi:hypothetical protein
MIHTFRDVQFMSAAQKTTTLRAWVRFLKSGLQFQQFTRALYDHLIQHCSFIAHYSRAGFYSHYFQTGHSTAVFLSQFDSRGPCLSVEYGGTYWTSGDYEDINRAMIAEAQAFIPSLLENARRRQKAADIGTATVLLARHGIPLEGDAKVDGGEQPVAEVPEPSQKRLPYA